MNVIFYSIIQEVSCANQFSIFFTVLFCTVLHRYYINARFFEIKTFSRLFWLAHISVVDEVHRSSSLVADRLPTESVRCLLRVSKRGTISRLLYEVRGLSSPHSRSSFYQKSCFLSSSFQRSSPVGYLNGGRMVLSSHFYQVL